MRLVRLAFLLNQFPASDDAGVGAGVDNLVLGDGTSNILLGDGTSVFLLA